MLTIERTIDSNDGWSIVLQKVINNAIWEDTIQGCTADVSLRIKVTTLPSNAQYIAS